jgi:dihydroorotase-like cyclic amidohydrolase
MNGKLDIQHPDDGLLFASFERIRDAGGLAKVHCENYELIRITEKVKASGRADLAAWDDSRPDFCEQDHLMRAGFMGKLTGVPLYAVHTSVEAHREEGRIIGRPGFGRVVACTPRTAGRSGNRTALK